MARLKDIPILARDGSNLPAVMEAVRETLQTYRGYRGDTLDQALTRRDFQSGELAALVAGLGSGTVVVGGGGGGGGGGVTPDTTPPPTPTGLAVTAGVSTLFITHDVPTYTQGHGHGLTAVYGAKWPSGAAPTFASAVKLFEFTGAFAAYPTDPGTRWCIWIKWQSNDGYLSTGPAGGTNGAQATTAYDPGTLKTALTGVITESELFSTLGARINLIDAPTTGLVAKVGDLQTAYGSTVSAAASAAAAALAEAAAILAQTGAETARDSAITSATQASTSAGAASASASSASTSAGAASVSASGAAGSASSASTFAIAASNSANAAGMSASAASSSASSATTAAGNAGTYSTAANNNAIAASTSAASALTYSNNAANSASTAAGYAAASAMDYSLIQVRLNNFSGSGVSIETSAAATASTVSGLSGQYTVKIDVNGYVSGFGLASTANGAAPTSSFVVRADSFSVASPSGPGITPAVPFIVRTTSGTVNGVSYPAGVYIDAAYILDLTAAVARLGSAWIDNAMVGNLSASKLTVGDGTVGGNLKSTTFTAGSAGTPGTGWLLTPAGALHASGATIYGTIYASAGVFAGSLSAATGTFSGNLSAAGGTFAGALSAATGTFAGALSAATGSFTGTLTVGSTPAVSGSTMTGSGGVINTSGTFALGSSATNITYNGSQLTLNGPVVFSSNIQNSAITDSKLGLSAFTATIPLGNLTNSVIYGHQTYGTRSVDVSGGVGPYSYFWTVSDSGYVYRSVGIAGSAIGSSVVLQGSGDGTLNTATVTCLVKDSNGRVTFASFEVAVDHSASGGGGGGSE